MNEKKFRSVVVELLKDDGAFPVEDAVHVGVPDICCVHGWLELKIARRPKRANTCVRVDLRPAQRIWLRRWSYARGKAWTLTAVDDDWFLHDGLWASEFLGNTTEEEMRQHASAVWSITPKRLDLLYAMHGVTPP
jgi:hypothetical protein